MTPTQVGGAGIGASAGGSLLGAFGSIFTGKAQSNQASYQAGIAQINKQIALKNAEYERNVGEVQAQQSGMKTRSEIGQTKAIQASSGFDVNKGSNVDVRSSEALIGKENVDVIRSNAARRAYGYEVEAVQDEAQSNIYKMAGANAKTAGGIGAIGSILGGASSVSSKWLQGNQTGLWGSGGDSGASSIEYTG